MVKKDEEIALVIEPRGIPPQTCSEQKRIPFRAIQTPMVIRSQRVPKNQPTKKVLFKKRTF
ncbi:MAG: hypothetical protein NTX91_00830 [candidate division SR1 bacterium]|nr:hypothetical protein [candidate division SR1 bacterium]